MATALQRLSDNQEYVLGKIYALESSTVRALFDFEGKSIDGKGDTSVSLPPAHPLCRCAATPALLDRDLERRLTGKRQTFLQWAEERGLTQNVYGQAFALRGEPAPRLVA